MKKKILENLKIFFGDEYDEALMNLLVMKIIAQVKSIRRYPDTYSDKQINQDMNQYEYNIFDVAVSLYNRRGVEGESSHSESGVNVSFISDNKLFDFVTPLTKAV